MPLEAVTLHIRQNEQKSSTQESNTALESSKVNALHRKVEPGMQPLDKDEDALRRMSIGLRRIGEVCVSRDFSAHCFFKYKFLGILIP